MAFFGIFMVSILTLVIVIIKFCIVQFIGTILFTIGMHFYRNGKKKKGLIFTRIGLIISLLLILGFSYMSIGMAQSSIEEEIRKNEHEHITYEYTKVYHAPVY